MGVNSKSCLGEAFDGEEVIEFSPADLPNIIANQVQKLNELEEKIKGAEKKAQIAKDDAAKARTTVTTFSGRKEAIEELQESASLVLDVVLANTEAQKVSFEFDYELAEISKFLFGLGTSNIAQNRIVVRELELKLKGASKEKISDLAKQELLSVVRQLKEQEDLHNRQEEHSKKLKIQNVQIESLKNQINGLNSQNEVLNKTVRRLEIGILIAFAAIAFLFFI